MKITKIEVKQSPIHGWGVFATEDIEKGELIEECPLVFLPTPRGETNYCLVDYTFVWPKSDDWTNFVVALGYGSVYNHSDTPNATWEDNLENKTFKFIATQYIKKGDEIFTYYGGSSYWSDGRTHVELK